MEKSGETGFGIGSWSAGSFARVRVGRIVEVHAGQLAHLTDVASFSAAVFAALYRAGPGAVICADYRDATPFTGEVANAWSRAMRRTNASIARSAILLDPSNTMYNLQLERVVHCAGSEDRRLFKDADELCDWLDGILTKSELEAVKRWSSRDRRRSSQRLDLGQRA